MRFRSISEHASATAAQKEFDDLDVQGQRPADAVIYDAELYSGEEAIKMETAWGEIIVQQGSYIFTSPEGDKFAVHPSDTETVWESV